MIYQLFSNRVRQQKIITTIQECYFQDTNYQMGMGMMEVSGNEGVGLGNATCKIKFIPGFPRHRIFLQPPRERYIS